MLLALLVPACATPFPPELKGAEPEPVVALLADSYQQASENYLYEANVSEMALSGLSEISQVYDGWEVTPGGDIVTVALRNEEILRFARPAETDIDGWATQVATALIAVAERPDTRDVPSRRLFEAHMQGVAKALGSDVEYISFEAFWEWLREFPDSAPAFTYRRTDAGLQVVDLDSGGRLEKEGLRLGDVITAIDGADVTTLKSVQLFQLLVGQEGSKVVLSVGRGDPPQPLSLQVTRWKPEPLTVRVVRHGAIAAFELTRLSADLTNDFWKAMRYEFREAKFAKKPLTGLLVDLRGVSGGVDEAIGFTEIFLGAGVKLVERGRLPSSEKLWKAGLPDESERLPLVVLIDGLSGLGAEVVAAALQDNGRALLIGSSTFGAGVRYDPLTLPDNGRPSSLGLFSMPTKRLYAPSGYGLEGRGVVPDICIAGSERSVEGWLTALRRGQGLIGLPDRLRHIDPDDDVGLAAHRALCPAEPDLLTFHPGARDTLGQDLAERLALAILNDPALYRQLLRPSF